MRFSAEWFKKLFSFAGKREETSLTDEAGASLEEIVVESEEVVEKPSLRKRLMGLFKHAKTSQPEESETIGQDEAQAVPETKAQSDVEAAAPIDEAGNGEEVAEKKDDEQPSSEEMPKKGLWARLRVFFSRKSSEQSAADLADAGELFSWDEGHAAVPVAEKDKKDEKGDAKSTDKKGVVEEEEQPAAGFSARIGVLVRSKKVWISLLLVTVIMGVFVVSITLYQLRAREHARMLELEKKNKQLQEENKKLQAPKKQTVSQLPQGPEAPSKNNRAGNQGAGKGKDSTGDCTVSDKANAAEVLKHCIDSFNALDRR